MTNSVTLRGNLTFDPELKFMNNGTAYVRMRLAVNKRWKSQSGDWEEKVGYYTLIKYGPDAEAYAELSKGDEVIAHGVMEWREYGDTEKKEVVEVRVESLGRIVRARKEERVPVKRVEAPDFEDPF